VPLCAATPAMGCRTAAPDGSTFTLKDATPDTSDMLKWKWGKGAATAVADFGDPVNGTPTYRLCVYDASTNPQPLMSMNVPPGGTCATKPCWKATATQGFAYKNKLAMPDGITVVKLKMGAVDGRAKVQAVGKGDPLPMPTLPLALPVTVQLVVQDGAGTRCWQTKYTTMKSNTSVLFNATGPPPYPAPHPALPQVVNFGGPVIANPVVYPIMFANEDATRAATLADFLAQFGASTHWTATTAEYGIGPMTVTPAIIESATGAFLNDTDIQTWLAGKLNADDVAFPPVDANTLFVLFYPAGVQITLGGFTSCSGFGGYHSETTLDDAHSNLVVPYVVVPNCATPGDPNGINNTTAVTSHELVEASTDPRFRSAPAYSQVDNDHLAWFYGVGGGELCDLCAEDPASYVPLASSPYVVQRCWSNLAAAASHDPCVPDPVGQAYFNAAPDLPDTITLFGMPTKAVTIPTGTSRTIPLKLFSDAATDGLITVTAYEPSGYNHGLSFSFDKTQGLNGVSLNLTITATRNIRSAALFIVQATVGPTSHFWFGLVAQ
jgi:hypothetical protein